MRRQAVLVLAVLAGVLAFFTLAWPFDLGLHDQSPNVHSSVRCSAPLVQLFDPPRRQGLPRMTEPAPEDPNGFIEEVVPNVQPRCREVGRSRAAAGFAMLTVGVSLVLVFRTMPERRRSSSTRPEIPTAMAT